MKNETTLHSLWSANASWYKHEQAHVFAGRRLTYGQVVERAWRLATALFHLGMRSQDRFAILAMNSDTYLEIYAAGELSGFIVCTVNFRLASAEITHIVCDTAPKVVFFEAQYAATMAALRPLLTSVTHFVCIGEAAAPDWALDFEALVASSDASDQSFDPPDPSDIAYIIHTSGTTGRAKGCMLDHASQVSCARYIGEMLQMSASSRTLLMMPLYHVGAKALQLAQAWCGGQVHIQRSFDVETILSTVQAERITHLHLAPTMVQTLIEHPALSKCDLSSIRSICYSAAPMPEGVLRKGLQLLGPVFVGLWGQSEGIGCVLPALAHRPDGSEAERKKLRSIGHPFPGMSVRIVGEDDQTLPVGQPGEMLLQGSVMMRGYWNQSAATIEVLRGGWLHTGDVCVQEEDGFLYMVDRKKDVIISGGENIYSREVEEAIASHPSVHECAVIGMPNKRWGEAVCAVVVKRDNAALSELDVVGQCRTLIAAYKRPRYVVFCAELPKLPSGKVSKLELRKKYVDGERPHELAS